MAPTLKKIIPSLMLAASIGIAGNALAAEHLRGEKSAFIKGFVDSPVDWMPWGQAAMDRAKAEQRPVFLFIGSFTNELSGAMRRQSFSNPKNADWLNKQFVCVVVDRDERPDVAALFQSYVNNLKQMNGWPINVWLTPEFQPFEGATYLSPSEDWGAPGFLKLANQAKTAWETDPAACRKRALDSVAQLVAPSQASKAPAWNLQKCRSQLIAAAAAWEATFDAAQGGFGDLPKAPEPELVRFMLLESPIDRDSAFKTLRAIASSAVRDPLDGGFFRHATDAAWHIPYPQKTLADQARIAVAFLDAAVGPDAKSFRQCARGALDFALTRLANADGTYASAEDATGDAYSGYYAWTEAEIDAALGTESATFKDAHGVLPDGNVAAGDDPSATYAHKNLLRSLAETTPAQESYAATLLAIRDKRVAPPRDERATAAEHGLFLYALARAGAQLRDPKYVEAAGRLMATIRTTFVEAPDGTIRRLRDSDIPGEAEDYVSLSLGCREYGRATKDADSVKLTNALLVQLASRYFDPASNAYFGAPAASGPGFFMRPMAVGDPPAAESMALPARAVHATAIAAQLSESLDESSLQAPGDQLLGLAFFSGLGPVR
jgi:uncharacterized protein YyaL (SSP411 family)